MMSRVFGKSDEEKREDEVQQAVATMTAMVYCRKQASALAKCANEQGAANAESHCAAQHAAFVTCSKEHVARIIGDLCKVIPPHAVSRARTPLLTYTPFGNRPGNLYG